MLMRVNYFVKNLHLVWDRYFPRLAGKSDSTVSRIAEQLFALRVELDEAVDRLQFACHVNNEAKLRDAAVTLVQVLAAYAVNPDLDWLGCPANWPQASGPLVRQIIWSTADRCPLDLTSRTESPVPKPVRLGSLPVIQGIAMSLALMRDIWLRPTESEDLVEWLRRERRLVIVDRRPRLVYLDGRQLTNLNWDRNSKIWDFVWKLAQRAQLEMPVSADELVDPEAQSTRAVANLKSRLCKAVPEFAALIVDVPPRGYRLELSPIEIGMLELSNDEQLVEVGLDSLPHHGSLRIG
jgi:hypothetical protein